MAEDIPYSDDSQPTLISSNVWRQLVDIVNSLQNAEVSGGDFKCTRVNTKLTIDEQSGSGVPEGYVETAAELCIDGEVTPGSLLFKPD